MTTEFESYDQIKDKVKKDYEKFRDSSKTIIPKAVNALKIEDPRKTKEEIKDIIIKDFLSYWTRRTIMDALGNEYKDKEKQTAAQQTGKTKEEILQTVGGSQEKNELPNKDSPATLQHNNKDNTSQQQQPTQETSDDTPAVEHSMVEQLHIINVGLKKDVERLMDENMRLKQENQELKAELIKHRRLEELRLEAQRKAINQWNQPGHKP